MPAMAPEERFAFDEEDGGVTVTVVAAAEVVVGRLGEVVEAASEGRLEAVEVTRGKAINNDGR